VIAVTAVGALAACGAGAGVITERAEPAAGPATTDESDVPSTEAPIPPATLTPETGSPTTAPDDTEPGQTDPPDTEPVETDPPDSGPSSAPSESTGELEWEGLTDGVEFAMLEVPADHDRPSGDTYELFVARRLADDQENRIGSLLVNPGGPGFGGSDFAVYGDQVYGEELLERFDIIGWDPRGTGRSEPAVDCIDDYDRFYGEHDITPDDDAERRQIVELAEQFATDCESRNGDVLSQIGTNDTARDMDAIRRALGEDTISYFGFSYGSELGATWATLFPETVRAAVLDGASDPNADLIEHGLQQSKGFESTLSTFLTQCSEDTTCAFHNGGDTEAAFDELMASLDEDPIPSAADRPDVNRLIAVQAVIKAMYSDSSWPQLAQSLADAEDGDGAGLLALYDSYYQRLPDGTWGNELEAFQAISCADDEERPTVEEDDASVDQFQAVAPRIAPHSTGSYFCTFFPKSDDPRVDITGSGAGPIVVIGTTGDAATPLDSTRAMAETLEDGRLVIVTADQHTGYDVNDCVNDAVHRYLVDLEPPEAETQC